MSKVNISRLIDEELKHCPFCGKGQSIVDIYENSYGFWTVGCGRCGSHSGVSKDKQAILNLWNSRPEEKKTDPQSDPVSK